MAIKYLNNISLEGNQLQNASLQQLGSDPAGYLGQIIINTTSNTFKYYNGSVWIELTGGGGGTVTSVGGGSSTFVSIAGGPITTSGTLTASLSATGTPSSLTFLRGDNTWAAVSSYSGWTLTGSAGTPQTIGSGDTATIAGGTYITTTASATDTLTVAHNTTSRSDTTSSTSPASGGTFTAVDSVTTNSTGHLTSLNLKTVTIPVNTPQTVTLTGDVTGTGTTSITTTIAAGAVDFAMINPVAVITSSEGIANNDVDTALPTSAAVKAYVDSSVAGGLIYQGGYNAATNTPNLDSTPIAGIKKGWTYTVTVDGLFFTEQVRVGDVIIAEIDSPTTLADWTTVQNNIDVASLSVVGIGNVNAGTGTSVSYSNGTATVTNTDLGSSQSIFKNVAVSGQSTVVAGNNNDTLTFAAGSGVAITTNAGTDTVTISQSGTSATSSYATTISVSGTITYSFTASTANDVMIQLVDTVTGETVYADVSRTSTTQAAITFASAPTNPIRVLAQKIA
jgi:acyl-CoA hydrolase